MKTLFSYTPIGHLWTPYNTLESIPKSMGRPPVAEGVIELEPVYEEGLLDIEGFSHPVELLSRQGRNLQIRGVDVVDGTPVLDIKPYLRHFDCRPEAGIGWIGEQ